MYASPRMKVLPGDETESKSDGENDQRRNGEKTDSDGGSDGVARARSGSTERPIVSIENLHKTYLLGIEGVAALRGVSLSIRKGEFVMLLGKSGSGKTSLLNIIGSIDQPTRGDVAVCGVRYRSKTKDDEYAALRRDELGFVFQTFNLIESMTAVENVALPMTLAGLPRADALNRAQMLLSLVGLGHRLKHEPSQLSGGEQQRVTIARALANSPSLLLLDEPTGDLDSVNTDNIMAILTALNRIMNVTMIMVTHDPHLKGYAHKAFHMLDGKLSREETIAKEVRKELFVSKGLEELIISDYRGLSKNEMDEKLSAFLEPRQNDSAATVDRNELESGNVAAGDSAEGENLELRRPDHYFALLGMSTYEVGFAQAVGDE